MQILKNRKRKQVAHRKRKAFGGSALVVTTHLVDGLPSLRAEATMRQVHRGLRYVLNNARKHGVFVPHGKPDPYSSGPWFQHWRERLWQPFRTDPSPVARPRIAMMVELACKNMPVGLNDLPGSSIDLWR